MTSPCHLSSFPLGLTTEPAVPRAVVLPSKMGEQQSYQGVLAPTAMCPLS